VPGVAPKQSSQATKAPKRVGAAGVDAGTKPTPESKTKEPVTVLFDRVLVQVTRADGERRSRAGILIPATAEVSRRLSWGEVVAVGPHVRAVKPGDKVLFNPEDRFEVEVQGEEYVILRERDIHAMASERIDGGTGLYL
jgi:chaperonin GroES